MISLFVVVVLGLLSSSLSFAVQEEYFLVQQDVRKCAFPTCGGYFLTPVNVDKFDCPGGEKVKQNACYVVQITGITVTQNTSMVRGKFVPYNSDLNSFQAWDGYEGKIHSNSVNTKAQFYTANDIGISCLVAPCNTIRASKLNQKTFSRNNMMFAEVDSSAVNGNGDTTLAIQLKNSEVILAASSYRVTGPGGDSQGLTVSNYFLKSMQPATPCSKGRDCPKAEFCSKASCGAMSGVCQARPSSCDKSAVPVCSCDGVREYQNDCVRMLLGVTASTPGKCAPIE